MAYVQAETCSWHIRATNWIKINPCFVRLNTCGLLRTVVLFNCHPVLKSAPSELIWVLKFFYVILILLADLLKNIFVFSLIAAVSTTNPARTDLRSNPASEVRFRRLTLCEKTWKCHDFDRAAVHAWLAFDIGVLRTAPAVRHNSCISIIIEI
jgi:hypothetical protein